MSYGDNPIDKAAQDRLDRRVSVEALRSALVDPDLDTPLAVGIYGAWGSGKTSVMRMLQGELAENGTTLWFDAWQYAHQDEALWRALLLRVVERLREELDAVAARAAGAGDVEAKRAELETELDRLVTSLYRSQTYTESGDLKVNWRGALPLVLQTAMNFVPGGEGMWKTLKDLLSDKDQMDEALALIEREQTERYREKVGSIEQFQSALRDLVQTHVTGGEAGRRLYVFVDDLDRCLPESAVNALEAIKLFLDIPGCVFLLGMDRNVVEQGIRVRYGDMGQAGGGNTFNARDYLDKIIQIPFNLPPLSDAQIERFIHRWCGDFNEDRLRPCAKILVGGVPPNPRGVKRTLNLLRLTFNLREAAQGVELSEMERELICKLVVLQISDERLYMKVAADPPMLKRLERIIAGEEKPTGTDPPIEANSYQGRLFTDHAQFKDLTNEELEQLVFTTRATTSTPDAA